MKQQRWSSWGHCRIPIIWP